MICGLHFTHATTIDCCLVPSFCVIYHVGLFKCLPVLTQDVQAFAWETFPIDNRKHSN